MSRPRRSMLRNIASRSAAFRARGCAVLLACLVFPLVLGVAALPGGTGETAARPQTLANVPGSVASLAQEGRRIAWQCGGQVQVLTLPHRRPVHIRSGRGKGCSAGGARRIGLSANALSADGRVLWQADVEAGNTFVNWSVFTAALHDPRPRLAATAFFDIDPGSPDEGAPTAALPTAADGKAIFFYTTCNASPCSRSFPSAIYRLAGRRVRRVANVSMVPAGLSVSGRQLAVVTNSPRCCSFAPAWSHDGTRLAWVYHGDLWTVGADGTGSRQLATGVSPRGSSSDAAPRPSWSPDDARLVFERVCECRRYLYRVDAAAGGQLRLAEGRTPSWSPDGTKIVFVRAKAVFSINPDGTGLRKLTAAERATQGQLSWSPDSTRIAVSRAGDIYSVRADGSGETRLTRSGQPETQPAWSPDGSRIAYVDGSAIAVVNADGSGATRLVTADEGVRSPAWSPDSTQIAFVRVELSQGALRVVNADGSGERQLIPSTRYVDAPQWVPGGRSITVGDWHAGDGNWPQDPGIRLVLPADRHVRKIAPLPHLFVQGHDIRTGRLMERFMVDGHARAVALGSGYVALLVDHAPGVRVELYNLNGSFRRAAAVPRTVRRLSAAGPNVVFAIGRAIRRLDSRTGAVTTLATAHRTPFGLSIEGHRIVWAENTRGAARIRTVTAP
jgi:Tol biopolymer transport system component